MGEQLEEEVVRLRAEVERLRAGQGRRGEQLRRLMAELKAARANRAGAEAAFEQLNEAVAGLRREEERRADQAVAERDKARAELQAQRAATTAAEVRSELEARRADTAEGQLAETRMALEKMQEEHRTLGSKLTEEQQRADRVLIQNLQLASRVRQLEQDLQDSGGVAAGSSRGGRGGRDLENGTQGADGAQSAGMMGRLQEMWNLRDRKGVMVLTVLSLLIFWYISSYNS